MSSMGVPSIMSMLRTPSTLASRESTSSTDNPIEFGRLGEQILNTPQGSLPMGRGLFEKIG